MRCHNIHPVSTGKAVGARVYGLHARIKGHLVSKSTSATEAFRSAITVFGDMFQALPPTLFLENTVVICGTSSFDSSQIRSSPDKNSTGTPSDQSNVLRHGHYINVGGISVSSFTTISSTPAARAASQTATTSSVICFAYF